MVASSWGRMSILARLLLLVATALAPVVAIQVYDEIEHRRAREAELHGEAVRLALLVGTEQERVLEGARQLLTGLAQLRGVRMHDKSACAELFGRLGPHFPAYAYVATADLDGDVLCSTAPNLTRAELRTTQSSFWMPLTSGGFSVEGHAVMADGTAVLQLGYPVFDVDGAAAGVVVAGLRLDRLTATLQQDMLPPQASLTISDRNGIVIAHLPQDDGSAETVGSLLSPERQALLHAPRLASTEGGDGRGRVRIFGYSPAALPPGDGVYVEVGLDKAAAFAEIDQASTRRGLAVLAALAIGGALSWLGFRYFLRRPIKALFQAAQHWRRGDWSARVGAVDAGSELGRLAHAFDRMAQALSEREAQLIKAKDDAEIANRTKSTFLANMTHELRTPLNAIIGFSDVMSRKGGTDAAERYGEYARYINASGQQLLRLVNDILDLSKLASGQLEFTESLVDVAQLVRSAIAAVMPGAREKSLRIATELPDDLPAVMAGELRLKQALTNILANAVKFSHKEGAVTVGARLLESGELALTVADCGVGMKPEEIPLALEPFRQLDNALSRAYQGVGLGLPLAKKLIEKHGGSLGVASAPEIGTTVTLTLPRSRVRPPAPATSLLAAQ